MQLLVLYIYGICRARVFCMCGTWEVIIVLLAVEIAFPPFQIYREGECASPLFCLLPVRGLCRTNTKKASPAHLTGVIRDMFASFVVSEASCVRG